MLPKAIRYGLYLKYTKAKYFFPRNFATTSVVKIWRSPYVEGVSFIVLALPESKSFPTSRE